MEYKAVFRMLLRRELPSVRYMLKRIDEQSDLYYKKSGISKRRMKLDYVVNAALYGVTCNDYFLYQFFFLNRIAKKRFVSESFQMRFELANTNSLLATMIDDKEQSLKFFERYISRDWCGLHENNSEQHYLHFFENYTKGVLKTPNGVGGTGVEIVELHLMFQSADQLRAHCLGKNLLLEEVIPQHERLNEVYPNAINTIRMLTLRGRCIGAALRMGVGEANVDNAHAGGIFAEVDIKTGIVIGRAMNYLGQHFTVHPTTGTSIPGVQIPFWKECVTMVEDASCLVSDVALLGWDVAVTPDGPTLVEVNTFPGLELVQAPNGNGLMHEFEKVKQS